jgi:hypothetical protein
MSWSDAEIKAREQLKQQPGLFEGPEKRSVREK